MEYGLSLCVLSRSAMCMFHICDRTRLFVVSIRPRVWFHM